MLMRQARPVRRSTTQVNDMSTYEKTRRKAYEVPTWAIGNAIRKRADKAKPIAPDDPQQPQRQDGIGVVVGPDAISRDAAS